MWAILSGIEGNLAAYDAVVKDLCRQRQPIQALYILGDVIGQGADNIQVIERLRQHQTTPPSQGLQPHVCQGWWEEQLLTLYGLGRTGEPTELIERHGKPAVKTLWDSVPRTLIEWIRQLDFGIFELDCLLIHGSSVSVSDELTPATPPIQMLERLMRMDANLLFCGRSGLTFEYEIAEGRLESEVVGLDQPATPQTATVQNRRVIGVGNVGRQPGEATYTLYNPSSNHVCFQTVHYGVAKGFARSGSS
jgi:hypothetical protein